MLLVLSGYVLRPMYYGCALVCTEFGNEDYLVLEDVALSNPVQCDVKLGFASDLCKSIVLLYGTIASHFATNLILSNCCVMQRNASRRSILHTLNLVTSTKKSQSTSGKDKLFTTTTTTTRKLFRFNVLRTTVMRSGSRCV